MPTPVDPDTLADLAERAGRVAAVLVLDARRAGVRIEATKSSPTDLVTATDRAVERAIVDTIRAERPDDAFVGEEAGRRDGSTPVTWVIDPIDGTTNFVYGLPGFNVSIAAVVDGRSVAGVVVDPVRDEVFPRCAWRRRATCNGTPVRCRATTELDRALVATGFAYGADRRHAQARVVTEVIGRVRDIRRQGAAALDLCHVGAGRLDAYFESGLRPWDLAAGALVAREAGCRVGGLDSDTVDGRLVVAAAPGIWDDLRTLLRGIASQGLEVEDPSARPDPEFGRLVG